MILTEITKNNRSIELFFLGGINLTTKKRIYKEYGVEVLKLHELDFHIYPKEKNCPVSQLNIINLRKF